MQGVFDDTLPHLSANWAGSLDPDVDDMTQQHHREQQQVAAFAEQVRAGHAPGAAAAPPVPPVNIPLAPPVTFQVKGTMFFVMKGTREINNLEQRPGIWGKYTVPYYLNPARTEATPYQDCPDNAPQLVLQNGDPGVSEDNSDTQPKPSLLKCKRDIHFVQATPGAPWFWEIGLSKARVVLEGAEALDLAFARRMEGLAAVAPSVVWNCLDPDYDPSDREAVMAQFMQKYLERFYAHLEPTAIPDIESVSAEVLHKHKVFCQTLVQKHYRGLTPAVTSPAEALASEFYQHVEHLMDPKFQLTHMELARVLMRHKDFATEFATALHYYSGSLEQSRGGRNATYKQMTQTNAAKINSYKRLGTLLDSKWQILADILRDLSTQSAYYMHLLTVDWYDILGQVPPVHRYFDALQGGHQPKRRGGGNDEPPWTRFRN